MTNGKRCRRCNGPHYEHPDAASDGGSGRLLSWQGGYCPICLSKRREQEAAALPYRLRRRVRNPTQEALTEYV